MRAGHAGSLILSKEYCPTGDLYPIIYPHLDQTDMQSSISSSQYSLCAASVTTFFSIGSLLSAQKMIDYPHQNLTEIAKNDKISSLISNSFPVTCLPLFFSKTPLNCFSSSLPFHAAFPPPHSNPSCAATTHGTLLLSVSPNFR